MWLFSPTGVDLSLIISTKILGGLFDKIVGTNLRSIEIAFGTLLLPVRRGDKNVVLVIFLKLSNVGL